MKKNKVDHPLLFKAVMLAAGLFLGLFCARIFFTVMTVNTDSMEPSVRRGSTVLLSAFSPVRTGDIVAIENPAQSDRLLLLRVLAEGNDTVEIRNRVIYINDNRFEPRWKIIRGDITALPMKFCYRDNMPPLRLGRNEYFLMSDSYDEGYDSRVFGKIDASAIAGKAVYILR
ncbi:MAG TPA: signal peptidase I [Spirochaetota bacterium]|nr:signal peptidase I [Spirochaetota bacterium]HQO39360.1 signal peptidase I [Spirochaetota bacterium]